MSGIEIAGLVLGAFPLLLAALDRYREGAEVLTDWWRIQRAYKRCKQDLEYHRILFEGNIERFLLPLVVDENELKHLIADPAGRDWEDKTMEQRLRERLPKAYYVFLDIIGDINQLMEALKAELGVQNKHFQAMVKNVRIHCQTWPQDYFLIMGQDSTTMTANMTRTDLLSISNMEFQAKRIKFSLKKSSRERLFKQLQEANDRMRNLLESSDQIAAARRDRESKKPGSRVNRKFNEFWQHAKRLHEILTQAVRTCTCPTHVANLQLQHRSCDNIEFDILFQLKSNRTVSSWRETKIKVVTAPPAIDTSRIGTKSKQPAAPSHTAALPRRVRIADPSRTGPGPNTRQNLNAIQDLCTTLSAKCNDCFGFLDDDEHRFEVYPGTQIIAMSNISTVSLANILQNSPSLTRRKRYFLALTLASSYLQLGSTPWLSTSLDKEKIVFVRDGSNADDVSISCPYIRLELSSRIPSPSPDSIASLGIRLLELCYGSSIETNSFRKQLPIGDPTTAQMFDYAAALQWSKLVSEEAGPEFADAIEWCLRTRDFGNGDWRKDIYQHVIVPLDSCHKQVSQKPV